MIGFIKKAVIADSLGTIVDLVYSMNDPTSVEVLMATYAFALQIYCDFSGYSNMARGVSHFFGIKLITNFNLPYLSKTPREFWRRWHISLSMWARDYIYIPLGGKSSAFKGLMPLFISFFLIGLWHGAGWNFIAWGIYWFVVTMIYRLISWPLSSLEPKILNNKIVQWMSSAISIIVFFNITCVSWILFRAQSLGQAKHFLISAMEPLDLITLISPAFFNI